MQTLNGLPLSAPGFPEGDGRGETSFAPSIYRKAINASLSR